MIGARAAICPVPIEGPEAWLDRPTRNVSMLAFVAWIVCRSDARNLVKPVQDAVSISTSEMMAQVQRHIHGVCIEAKVASREGRETE